MGSCGGGGSPREGGGLFPAELGVPQESCRQNAAERPMSEPGVWKQVVWQSSGWGMQGGEDPGETEEGRRLRMGQWRQASWCLLLSGGH